MKRFFSFLVNILLATILLFPTNISYADETNPVKKSVDKADDLIPQMLSKSNEIEIVADDLQYDKETRKMYGVENVVVTYQDIELTADQIEINVDTKEAHAKGHVVIRQGAHEALSGEDLYYNFNTHQGRFPNGRFYQFLWYGYGKDMEQMSKNKFVAKDVYITTCDLRHPHWDIKAQSVTVYSNDKLIAKNVFFRILETPVFWWPILIIPLDDSDPLIQVTPGYSNDYGAYVQTAKSIAINKNIKGKVHADWYSKRGFGAGIDLDYQFKYLGKGDVRIYGIRDKRAPNQKAEDPYEDKSKKDRGRVSWRHKTKIDPLTTLQAQWNEISDERFLQDFFEREYRAEIQPQSYITVTRNATEYSLLAHIEKRTNPFQNTGEKLPEIIFTWLRKPLFGTNFYYTNEEGFQNFRQKYRFQKDGPETVQFYTDHELSRPFRLFRYYNFNPYVNAREDFYSRGITGKRNIDRFVGGGGFDASTRFYKLWNYEGKVAGLEINKLRHVLEPIIQYRTNQIATVKASKLVQTGRGDNIGLEDIFTFGLENRIQTKRKMKDGSLQRVDLVSFNAFLDYSFGPGNDLLLTRKNTFTESRFEVILRPYDWFAVRATTTYDVYHKGFSFNNVDAIFTPGRLYLSLSHRYNFDRLASTLDSFDPDDKNLLTVDAAYALNDKWSIGGYVRWNATKNISEEYELRASRDLHDWLLDFGVNVRDSDRNTSKSDKNKEFFVELQLKAFPFINLHAGHRASFARPRVGQTVSGSDDAPLPAWLPTAQDPQTAYLSTSSY